MANAKDPSLWLAPEEDPRELGAVRLGNETETLREFLRCQRLTLELKCADLSPEQLARRSVEPSTMSLLGLIRHMAAVEHSWVRRVMLGCDIARLYGKDQNNDSDFDGAIAAPDVVAEAWRCWREQVAFTDQYLMATSDMGTVSKNPDIRISLREVVTHLIEEYARHNGHADLIRERIDGRTGE